MKQVIDVARMPVTNGGPGEENEEVFTRVPSFDHAVGEPVPDAIAISSKCQIVIVEVNNTLLDQEPWRGIADVVDER